jgi:hypothetical protein
MHTLNKCNKNSYICFTLVNLANLIYHILDLSNGMILWWTCSLKNNEEETITTIIYMVGLTRFLGDRYRIEKAVTFKNPYNLKDDSKVTKYMQRDLGNLYSDACLGGIPLLSFSRKLRTQSFLLLKSC